MSCYLDDWAASSSDNFTTDQRGWASSTFCQLADITARPPCWVVWSLYRDSADIMMTMTLRAIVHPMQTGADDWRAVPGRRSGAGRGTDSLAALTVPAVALALPTHRLHWPRSLGHSARLLVNRYNKQLPGPESSVRPASRLINCEGHLNTAVEAGGDRVLPTVGVRQSTSACS